MTAFRTMLRQPLNTKGDRPSGVTSSVDAAWLVLEAANDLGDELAVKACRRVIDAGLNGRSAAQSDLDLVQHYFS